MMVASKERDFIQLGAVLQIIDKQKSKEKLLSMKNKNYSHFDAKLTEARVLLVKLQALEKMRLEPKSLINEHLSAAIQNVDFSSEGLSQQLNKLSEITITARTDKQAIQVNFLEIWKFSNFLKIFEFRN